MKFRLILAKSNFQIIILFLTTLTRGLNGSYTGENPRLITTMPADLKKLTLEYWCAGKDRFTTLCRGFPQYERCIGEVMQEEVQRVMDIIDLYDYSALKLGKNLLSTKCEEQKKDAGAREIDEVNNIPYYLIILVAAIGFLALVAMAIIYNRRKSRLNINGNDTNIVTDSSKNLKKMSTVEEKV